MVANPVAVQDAEYYSSAVQKQIFSAMTALTGVAPGTALGTTSAFTLYNPRGSGVNLVILEGRMGFVSGTLGGGVVSWNANTDDEAAAPTGTAIVEQNSYLGGPGSNGVALTTATIAAPTAVRPAFNMGALVATTAVAGWMSADRVDGGLIVPPGCSISLHATAAAGTTPLVVFQVTWKEENV